MIFSFPKSGAALQLRSVLLGSGLTDLLLQALTCVTYALVLVRIGLTQRAHIGGHLAYLLTVDAADRQVRLLGVDRHFNTRGQRELDRMRKAEREHHDAFALQLGAIANADDIQILGPALGDAFDCVEYQRAREAMQRRVLVVLAHR